MTVRRNTDTPPPGFLWLFDGSRRNYLRKKQSFQGVANLELQVPSHWLEQLVQCSYLQCYPMVVSGHTVRRDIFHPVRSSIRERLGIGDRIMLFGAASPWDAYKGLGDFASLSQMLDARFVLVLAGYMRGEEKHLPKEIRTLGEIRNPQHMAALYSAADIFLNLSVEETFSLTTLEAIACGTPVIVYKGTACEEVVDTYGGIAVERDLRKVREAIDRLLAEGGDRP